MKFGVYDALLKDIGNGFDGFTPRNIYPEITIGVPGQNATNLLLIIDSSREQEIGLAPNFNPFILGEDEVMLASGMLDFFNIEVGDQISFFLDVE